MHKLTEPREARRLDLDPVLLVQSVAHTFLLQLSEGVDGRI